MSQLNLLRTSSRLYSSSCRLYKSVSLGGTGWRLLGTISCSHSWKFGQQTLPIQNIAANLVADCPTTCPHTVYRGFHTSPRQQNTVTADVGGRSISFSTGKFAKLASGSALVQSGNTSVLVTAVSEKRVDEQARWLPLTVDYRDRGSATNKIPQTFFRRELRPSTKEYLASRFIDRTIRPLFPNGYCCNTQVICNMLAADGHEDHEILSVNGAAAALMLSDIPWNGPIGAVRVCLIDNEFCINPSPKIQSTSQLNVIVSCTKDSIVMVEGSAEQISEERLCEAVELGFNEAQILIRSLSELAQYRKAPTREHTPLLPSPQVKERVKKYCWAELMSILTNTSHSKMSRDNNLFSLLDRTKEEIVGAVNGNGNGVSDAFWMTVKQCIQELALDNGIRCDGRSFTELRDIECEVDTFKTLHGSAVFKRGESQVLCTVTFDSPSSAAKADILQLLLGAQKTTKFLMHYEFPPFATNSIGSFMNHSRREAGHGALAEKALAPLIPNDFPFTIRLNSQVLDSNGSTSMATICGGSLALFDAGVPMPRPVAGVACGLLARTNPDSGEIEKYQILTDILGIEDANGNMDFKIGGTREGVTSLQVDVKGVTGIPLHIFRETVMQSKVARHQVLDIMDKCQSVPREGVKDNGPACTILEVPQEKLGKLLGMGTHRLRAIAEDTGATFTILGEGKISIFAHSQEALDNFQERVDSVLKEESVDFEIGSVLEATVTEIRDHGLMVELAPRVSSLLHISKISNEFVSHPADIGLIQGDKVNVKYLGKDLFGRHQISRKALLQAETGPLDKPSRSPTPREAEFEVGAVIDATVKEVRDIGLMVELAPGVVSLLHIKNLAHEFVHHPADLKFQLGDTIKVKYLGKDHKGRPDVSRKALIPLPPNFVGNRRRPSGQERTNHTYLG